MSASMRLAAGRMSISSAVMPSARISAQALLLRALAGRETGHGEAQDVGARQAEPVDGLGRDDQRVAGIEPARDADDELFGARGAHPLDDALDLDVERFEAILVELGRACWARTGSGAVRAESRCRRSSARARTRPGGSALSGWPASVAASFQLPLRKRSCRNRGRRRRRRAESRRHRRSASDSAISSPSSWIVPWPSQARSVVLSPGTRRRRTHRRRRRAPIAPSDSIARSRALPIDDVRGRQVAADQRPGERAQRRGRGGGPVILADFGVEDEVGQVAGGEDQVGAERRALSRDLDVRPSVRRPMRTSASRNIRGNWAGRSWARRPARARA